jgi:hypothetical protein
VPTLSGGGLAGHPGRAPSGSEQKNTFPVRAASLPNVLNMVPTHVHSPPGKLPFLPSVVSGFIRWG